MATKFMFDGRLVKLPGAYSRVKSGIKNLPASLPYGYVLLIDTGSGAEYGGGSGVNGELFSEAEAVYEFENSDDFKDFVKGGIWWKMCESLFKPYKQYPGVSKLIFVKAATTVAATLTFAPTGGVGNGGTLVLQVKDEGLIGNGVENTDDVLVTGYAFTMEVGEVDDTKFILKFWVGNYRGEDENGYLWGGESEDSTKPTLLAKSIEFDNMANLIAWVENDTVMNSLFKIKTKTVSGTGVVNSADLITYAGNTLAIGGTEVYGTTDLDAALDVVTNIYYNFVLLDDYANDSMSANNGKIEAHILTEAKYQKFAWIGGGNDSSKFTQALGSILAAQYYNSDRVVVVHGGTKMRSQQSGLGFLEYDSIHKVCVTLGRLCGLAPQVPLTFKGIDIDGERHVLVNSKELEQCLDNGVLATYYDDEFLRPTVLQGINTLQNNEYLINEDGTSYSIQYKRIEAQLNNEIVINAKKQLLSDPEGINLFTLSKKDVQEWTIGYLQSRCVNETSDNLIVDFKDVSVESEGDAYKITYSFQPNIEKNKLFFTGIAYLD